MKWTVLVPVAALMLSTGVARADHDDRDGRRRVAPEFSATEIGSAASLIAGGLMVLAGRRRKSR